MKLRRATVEDIAAMHRVRLAVHENVLRDATRVTPDDYQRMLERDGRGWVCEIDGAVAGFAIADHARRNVWALFVHPHHERRGIGRALHDALLGWLFEIGNADVWLSTQRGSRAERFYAAAGWTATQVLPSGEQRFEMTAEQHRKRAARSNEQRLAEQAAYYSARAGEYDQWWLRQGRYDRGAAANARWFTEAAAVQAALDEFAPAGNVLELAGGTGIWSERLRNFATKLTVLDASVEMLERNAARLHDPRVRYVHADLFTWLPERRYDVVFFAFWLSHVPQERFARFWQLVAECLAPAGRFFFVDSLFERTSGAIDHLREHGTDEVQTRRLDDGREFDIYKIYYEPAELAARLTALGWSLTVDTTESYFLYGAGRRD
jgi:demethylmenaquinone methyltransferase/2-methoxy-6-polyprenyl-1,4-benzoquinol methylase